MGTDLYSYASVQEIHKWSFPGYFLENCYMLLVCTWVHAVGLSTRDSNCVVAEALWSESVCRFDITIIVGRHLHSLPGLSLM